MYRRIKIINDDAGNKTMKYYDSNGNEYSSIASIVEKLHTYRWGTQIRVIGEKKKDSTYNCKEMYYLVYNDTGLVKLIYCNLDNASFTVLAAYSMYNCSEAMMCMFAQEFMKIRNMLTILTDSDFMKLPSVTFRVASNPNWQIAAENEEAADKLSDEECVLILANGSIRMPVDTLKYSIKKKYRCVGTVDKSRLNLTLSDAVAYAMYLANANKGIYLVCNKETVYFAVRS